MASLADHVEGDRTKWVEVATELLEDLNEWTEPLQVMITRDDGGRLEMIFRRPEASHEQASQS